MFNRDRWFRVPKVFLIIIFVGFVIIVKFILLKTGRSPADLKYEIDELENKIEEETNELKRNTLKVFHLDLKGAPPKLEYLRSVLPLIQKAGANALLMEYEDMFPFWGKLKNISAINRYSRNDVNILLNLARGLNMEIIPLVQTFGHMEYVLKLAEFRHLRELDNFPQEICPSKQESFEIIKEILRQVMDFHKDAKFVHIGCDEVYHLAACRLCSRQNSKTIFTRHVIKVAKHIRDTYPGVTPLIWDDMLRKWSPADIEESNLGEFVEPVVWVYVKDILNFVPYYTWFSYKKTFQNVWVASAFKGAFGPTEVYPSIKDHVENNVAWLEVTNTKRSNIDLVPEKFRAFILTGWSRYDHFAVLCELLPIGLPSLLINLVIVDEYFGSSKKKIKVDNSVVKKWYSLLNCPADFPIQTVSNLNTDQLSLCYFPGSNLFNVLLNYLSIKYRYDKLLEEHSKNGWVTSYHVKHNYTSPYRILETFQNEGVGGRHLKSDVTEFKKSLVVIMTQYFDNYTVNEWIEQKLEPIETFLNKLEFESQEMLKRNVWQKRPIS